MRRIRARVRSFSGSGIGTADSSAWVYGCVGAIEHGVDVADLDDPSEVHHGDAVGDVADDGEVVGDEQVREAELGAELVEEVDDAGLDRHVEGGDRLVEDDQLGLEGERSGDADALALPAGEVLRVAVGVTRLEADELQQLVDALADRLLVDSRGRAIGSARTSNTGSRGSSDAIGSWNTTCRSRRIALR